MSVAIRELTAERLRVLGKPNAIALLEVLSGGEASVQELADAIDASHQNTSHHLSVLRQAGVVRRRSAAPLSIYAIDDWGAWWVIQQIAGLVAEESSTG